MVVLAFFFLNGSKSYKQITFWSFSYKGTLEKGSDDIVSAVCYTIYLSLWTQTAYLKTSEPFSRILLGTDLQNKKTRISSRILLFSCRTILFEPIGREKQNFTSFLLVEIKLFIKKTKIFLMIFLFRSFFCFVNPFSVVE